MFVDTCLGFFVLEYLGPFSKYHNIQKHCQYAIITNDSKVEMSRFKRSISRLILLLMKQMENYPCNVSDDNEKSYNWIIQ